MKFFIVDAFTTELFGGNPAGVALVPDDADFPPDEYMRRTAAELRYSETAFVKRIGEGRFRTRYFTPAAEVDLCGHATIATFHALAECGAVPREGELVNSTLAGDLNISLSDDAVWMDMATPEYAGAVDGGSGIEDLYSVMGLGAGDSCRADGFLPEIISTGLPDIIMPVASGESLSAIAPDFPALSALSERYGVVGVHAFCLPCAAESGTPGSGAAACRCRNFAPLYGIDEEAATGTSNGALTYYLYRRGLIEPGAVNVFIQGESMGRPSRVMTALTAGGSESGAAAVRVGGRAVTLASGELRR